VSGRTDGVVGAVGEVLDGIGDGGGGVRFVDVYALRQAMVKAVRWFKWDSGTVQESGCFSLGICAWGSRRNTRVSFSCCD